MQDSGSLAVFKVTASDQGHYKGPSGAFVTNCNISCFYLYTAKASTSSLNQEPVNNSGDTKQTETSPNSGSANLVETSSLDSETVKISDDIEQAEASPHDDSADVAGKG